VETRELRKQSEQRYRSLIEGAAYGIFRTSVEGQILDANPALAQMLGYGSVDELLALNMSAIYQSPHDRAALIDRYNRTRNPRITADLKWRRKDGSELCVHLSARIVTSEDGSAGFEGIVEDVTERRALEEELRRAHKMEAVGRLARGVAHDFNNVLAAILGTADLLLLRLKTDPTAREDALEIRRAAERGAALTKQLLAFSRSQKLEPTLLDLCTVVRQMGAMLQQVAGPEYPIAITTCDHPVTTRAEPGQIEQVLLNLVANARDAMPGGGTIDVEVSAIEYDGARRGRYAGLPAGEYIRLAVHDGGAGIRQDHQAHVFEPFFTTKGTTATGLGLSIVYGIARDLGGTVTFSTGTDDGTTFEVIVPRIALP